jgi:cytochrome c-type biogenesis protein CcmH/NrfG
MHLRALLAALSVVLLAPSAAAQQSQIDGLKAAARAQPNDPAAALALGRAYRRAGRTQEALTELRRGVNLARAAQIDLHWEIARTLEMRGDFGPTMVQCKVLGALPADSGRGRSAADVAAAGHACAAEAHLLWKRASEALVETALALKSSKSYEAKIAEAAAHELELKWKEAEAAYKEAIGWAADRPDAHVALGRMLRTKPSPDAEGAVRELREAARLDPTSPEIAYELGVALGPTPEALQLLTRATTERRAYGAAERRLAEVQLALGHIKEAHAAAETALKDDATDAGTHVTYGRVLLAENKPDDAIRAAHSALKILANSAPAKLLLADAYAKKNEIDLAVEAYQASYGLDHSDPSALVHAAEACRAAGRFTSARAFGMKATQEFPTWGPAWVAFGDALAADGEPKNARSAYESALKAQGPVDAAAVQAKIRALK